MRTHQIAAVTALASMAFPALAGKLEDQTVTVREPSPSEALTLAEMPSVQEDLQLTTDQRSSVRAIRLRLDRELNARFDAVLRLKGVARIAAIEKPLAEGWPVADARVFDVLSPEQSRRLRELQYQSLGFHALLLKDLREWLGLGPDQIAAITRLDRESSEQRSGYMMILTGPLNRGKQALSPEEEEAHRERTRKDDETFARMEKELETKALVILTPEQLGDYRLRLGVLLPSVEGNSSWVKARMVG